METITIRKASASDLNLVQQISRETFIDTFARHNSAADMAAYVEKCFNPEKVHAELTNPNSLFFIAWDADRPVGYLKVNTGGAQTELLDETALEIERIYVNRTHQGRNVGYLLYEKALDIARQKNKEYIWLGVWEENPRAIRFYEKQGFVPFATHLFMLGEDEQTDILMKKTLA
ncbi:GNAT family N-acetyltransferase [Spirosoma sp. KUDC1026]|uniref:GNAT family N-acetyltransferase n=1 Tax=Spirosoma sp. KUDC1026 TaxID=2745947 RepID=UPI00159BC07B|nr:GNAT family N-acetyltransferase [Spirosoma sp. KUDC1026]QKZ13959.1 GNAT family N-acetyltransferase [Spirosoma sp. KUDC1026]